MDRSIHLRNYLSVSIEGGLYIGGLAFLSAETILPKMVHSLGGPTWAIALVAVLTPIGFSLPGIFATHWIEKMRDMKPFIMIVGFFQRLPFLIAGLVLLFLGETLPKIALAVILVTPFLSGLIGGIIHTAFFELLVRIVPRDRRASNLAIRFIISGFIGILAGIIVKLVLVQYPGTVGYGILHLITFGLMMLSFLIFSLIREINQSPPKKELPDFGSYLKSLPLFLKSTPYLTRFIWIRATGTGFLVMLPFLSIHMIEVTGSSESTIGLLVVAQMVGALFGNLVSGYLGDQYGSRLPLLISKGCFLVVFLSIFVTESVIGFYLIFFLFGFAFYADSVSSNAIMTELAPVSRRPAYTGIVGFSSVPAFLIATAIGTLLMETTHSIFPACLVSFLSIGISMVLLLRLPEPRNLETSN